MDILKLENINKHFDGVQLFNSLNLNIAKETIVGIFGDNGTGKTTLFNIVSGREKYNGGKILFKDIDISKKSELMRAQMGIGRLFQNPRVFSGLTLIENLVASSNLKSSQSFFKNIFNHNLVQKENEINLKNAMEILEHISLQTKAKLKACELSVGEKRLLSLGSLMMNDSKIILLDEPFSGINNKLIKILKENLLTLKRTGTTILIIEHDKETIQELSDIVYELRDGTLNKIFDRNA